MVLERFQTIMGAVTLVYDTLTIGALGCLLQMEASEVHIALLQMHSLVIVPENEDEIWIIHPSFHDFMTQTLPRTVQVLYQAYGSSPTTGPDVFQDNVQPSEKGNLRDPGYVDIECRSARPT